MTIIDCREKDELPACKYTANALLSAERTFCGKWGTQLKSHRLSCKHNVTPQVAVLPKDTGWIVLIIAVISWILLWILCKHCLTQFNLHKNSPGWILFLQFGEWGNEGSQTFTNCPVSYAKNVKAKAHSFCECSLWTAPLENKQNIVVVWEGGAGRLGLTWLEGSWLCRHLDYLNLSPCYLQVCLSWSSLLLAFMLNFWFIH